MNEEFSPGPSKHQVLRDMDSKAESEPFLESALNERPRGWPQRHIFLHTITTANVLLFCASLTLYWSSGPGNRPGPYQTDIRDAWPAVQYEERTFTGALKYSTDTKELYREHDAIREYFGPPSILIEDAWDRLLHGGLHSER